MVSTKHPVERAILSFALSCMIRYVKDGVARHHRVDADCLSCSAAQI